MRHQTIATIATREEICPIEASSIATLPALCDCSESGTAELLPCRYYIFISHYSPFAALICFQYSLMHYLLVQQNYGNDKLSLSQHLLYIVAKFLESKEHLF